jgi:DNA-binding response OmpR family regulator
MITNRHLLIAEDDTNIRHGLIDTLESEGYTVEAVADGEAALAAFQQRPPALVLLDIMMPGRSGYDVCRAIRRTDTRTPIILLTAKGEELDKVVGLELGADDYVTKPFGVRELLARIAAVLRRSQSTPLATAPAAEPAACLDPLPFGAAVVDRKTYTLTCHGRTEAITAREWKLIAFFASRPHEVLSREELLNRVWGVTYYGTTRTLDQHIAQLRKKMEADPERPASILTVHGVGYRYVPATLPPACSAASGQNDCGRNRCAAKSRTKCGTAGL